MGKNSNHLTIKDVEIKKKQRGKKKTISTRFSINANLTIILFIYCTEASICIELFMNN